MWSGAYAIHIYPPLLGFLCVVVAAVVVVVALAAAFAVEIQDILYDRRGRRRRICLLKVIRSACNKSLYCVCVCFDVCVSIWRRPRKPRDKRDEKSFEH